MKIFNLIKSSLYDHLGKISHTRLSSYFILGSILTSALVFLTIDVINAFISYRNGIIYTVPYEHIAIYGMTLSHHLILLGYKRGEIPDFLKGKPSENPSTPLNS